MILAATHAHQDHVAVSQDHVVQHLLAHQAVSQDTLTTTTATKRYSVIHAEGFYSSALNDPYLRANLSQSNKNH